MSKSTKLHKRWNDQLGDEDLVFIRRFILASGSLKKVAQQYGISYPTVRLRLDRLIEKVALLSDQRDYSEVELALRLEYSEGNLDRATFKRLLAAYEQEKERGEP